MKTILLTGADGFIASHILQRLQADEANRIVAVVRRSGTALRGTTVRVVADLADATSTRELIGELHPDVVIHAAGRRGDSKDKIWRDNVDTAHAILDAVTSEAPDAHVILFGSAAEYGAALGGTPLTEAAVCRPTTAYGEAKLAITTDAMVRAKRGDVRVTVLRLFNPIGVGIPSTLAMGAFLEQIRRPRMKGAAYIVKMGPRDGIRDFVAADDVVTVMQKAIDRRVAGEIINVCTGHGRALDDLLRRMSSLAGAEIIVEENPAYKGGQETSISIGDCAKSLRMLNFAPSANLDATLMAMWRDATGGAGTPA
jgi:nucleoside-diphosphate-sugar epimerase